MDKTIKENEHYLRNVKKNFTTSDMCNFALDYFEHFKDEYSLNKMISPVDAERFLVTHIEKFSCTDKKDFIKLCTHQKSLDKGFPMCDECSKWLI